MPSPLPQGTLLDGGFKICEQLGAGGFGLTYRVHDQELERDFVIKEFFPEQWAVREGTRVVPREDDDARRHFKRFLDRFREEARAAARLDHPNLAKVHRYFAANGTGYFAMDWHEGETLETLLQRRSKIGANETVDLVNPLLDGLEALHKANLIHRDIKPENIYLRRNGRPLLLDFGAARTIADNDAGSSRTALVSRGYAPPEQYKPRGHQGPHTDVYALGAVMYRMLTGYRPASATDRYDESTEEVAISSCSALAPRTVPRTLCAVVDRAMALEIPDRIADTQTLRSELAKAMQRAVDPQQTVPQAKTRHRWGKTLGSTALASLAVAGAVLWGPELADKSWPRIDSSAAVEEQPRKKTVVTSPDAVPPTKIREEKRTAGITTAGPAPPSVPLPAAEALLHKVRGSLPAGDVVVSLALDPQRLSFVENEYLSVGFSTREPAHVAVFVYSSDGSVSLLYPNDHDRSGPATPDVVQWVGGDRKRFRIRVVPPFGTDIIHALAFRNPQEFRLLLDELAITKLTAERFAVERGSLERSASSLRNRILALEKARDPAAPRLKSGWGDAIARVSTQARAP